MPPPPDHRIRPGIATRPHTSACVRDARCPSRFALSLRSRRQEQRAPAAQSVLVRPVSTGRLGISCAFMSIAVTDGSTPVATYLTGHPSDEDSHGIDPFEASRLQQYEIVWVLREQLSLSEQRGLPPGITDGF